MSHIAPYWAGEQKGFSGLSKFILIALADYHNSVDGGCYPSIATLARKCCLSETAVKTSINELCEIGLVSRVERKDNNGRSRSNQYVLNLSISEGGGVIRPLEGAQYDPLEPVIYNQDIPYPSDTGEPPVDPAKEFWDEAIGMMMAMGVSQVAARPLIGKWLKAVDGDMPEVIRRFETAMATGTNDPIPYLAAAFKGGKSSRKKEVDDAFAELVAQSDKRKADWREKYGTDYGIYPDAGGDSAPDHGVLQLEPVPERKDVPEQSVKSVRGGSSRRVAEVVRPVIRRGG